jgi:hypothetical protein
MPVLMQKWEMGRIPLFEQGDINRKPQCLQYFINTLL